MANKSNESFKNIHNSIIEKLDSGKSVNDAILESMKEHEPDEEYPWALFGCWLQWACSHYRYPWKHKEIVKCMAAYIVDEMQTTCNIGLSLANNKTALATETVLHILSNFSMGRFNLFGAVEVVTAASYMLFNDPDPAPDF